MKSALLRFCLVLACSSSLAAQDWRDDRARLCFVRYEDNGEMNILQSWIRIEDYEVPVVGGQAVCLYVQPGSKDLVVTSTIPYDPNSTNTEACKSKALKFELTAGENRTFSISPASKGSVYKCGWHIEPASTSPKKPQSKAPRK